MILETPAKAEWTISVRDAHKRYGENVLFCGLDLLISPGRTVRIEGPNGSGKTQFLYALCGLVQFDIGEIIVANGHRAALVRSAYARDEIFRLVPAFPADLSQLSVEEFVHVVSRSLRPYSVAGRSNAAI